MDKEVYIKKLSYQSHHRGIKEADLLFGKFADLYLPIFDDKQLQDYEKFLQIPDADILDWIYGRCQVPSKDKTDMVALFLNEVSTLFLSVFSK